MKWQEKTAFSIWVVLCIVTGIGAICTWWYVICYREMVTELRRMHYMYTALSDIAAETLFNRELEEHEPFIQLNREHVYRVNNEQSLAQCGFLSTPSRVPRAHQSAIPGQRALHSTTHRWLTLPVRRGSFWISSLFGPRKQPSGKHGYHYGVDFAASRGTPVYASARGTVVYAGWCGGYGKLIVIAHGNSWKTRYAHLYDIHVRQGAYVTAGSRIGSVGDTGHVRKDGSDASHLHFEVDYNGKRKNPFYYLNVE